MEIKSLIEKRDRLYADAETIYAGSSVTEEQRKQVEAMFGEAATIDADIKTLKTIEERKSALRNPVSQPIPDPSQSNDPEERSEVAAANQKKEFRNWMRTGVVESRALTLTANGVVVPVGFDNQIVEARQSYGQILDLVNTLKTDNGEPIKMVLTDDVSNGLVALGSGATEADPTVSGQTLQVADYTAGAVSIDMSLLQDAGFDVDRWIATEFGKRFYRGASNLVMNGGTNVQSIVSAYATAATVDSVSAGVLKYADFVATQVALDSDYQANACWIMSQATLGNVLSILDGNGRPLFLAGYGDGTQGFIGSILGKPVKIVTQLPTVATGHVPVYYGDFKEGYTFRQVNPGIVIARDPYTLLNKRQMAFYGFARVGGIATDAGTHPVVSLTIS